jgi:hypothetical protein
MNGYTGLGSKPLKICSAVTKPKEKDGPTQAAQSATSIVQQAYDQYSQYYDQYFYWQQQQGYSTQHYDTQQQIDPSMYYSTQVNAQIAASQAQNQHYTPHSSCKLDLDDEYALVDYKNTIDVDNMNRETIERDRNLYDSLESSKWTDGSSPDLIVNN